LGHAPPQEPVSGYFADSWVEPAFLALLWGLISIGALLAPITLIKWDRNLVNLTTICWSVAGALLVLFSAMNYFTHIGLLINTSASPGEMRKLERKIALVTGGNSGIGLATGKEFVKEGAYVFIPGRPKKELGRAVKEIGKNGTAVQGDVSNLDDLERLFARIKQDKGKLDIVFANAGVAKYAPLGKITEEFYDSIFNINVKGVLFTVQRALP